MRWADHVEHSSKYSPQHYFMALTFGAKFTAEYYSHERSCLKNLNQRGQAGGPRATSARDHW
jgi:hypothetical protein